MVHDLHCCIRNTSGITGITYHIIIWSITMYSCGDSGVVLEYLPVKQLDFLRVPAIAVPAFLHSGEGVCRTRRNIGLGGTAACFVSKFLENVGGLRFFLGNGGWF